MKAYVMTTGAVFGLIVVAHLWRVAQEGLALAKDPLCIILTLAAAGLCFLAWRLFRLMLSS